MTQDFHRFYGKKSVLILKVNFAKKNGSIEIAPAIDENRAMTGPAAKGSNIYDYKRSKYFSISPSEAAKLLVDLAILDRNPDEKITGLFHDRGKSNRVEDNDVMSLNIGKWKDNRGDVKTTINIYSKATKESARYLLHSPADLYMFRSFLNAVVKDVVMFGLYHEYINMPEKDSKYTKPSSQPKNDQPVSAFSGSSPF